MIKMNIFFCAADEDEIMRKELEKRLEAYRRIQLINAFWHSQSVVPGAERAKEIDHYLNHAHVILLLISPDFIASDECDAMMKRAMQRYQSHEALVIAVILRPVDLSIVPFKAVKVLPANNQAIKSWRDEDRAFYEVGVEIRKTIEAAVHPSLMERPGTPPILTNDPTAPVFILSRTLVGHDEPVTSVAFNHDGELLISGSWDNTIKIWNRQAEQALYTFKAHGGPVHSVAVGPKTKVMASGGDDNLLKLWYRATGHVSRTFTDHEGPVTCLTFSSDGATIVSGSDDGTIKIWNVGTRQLLQTLKGHAGPVSSLALSRNRRFLISGGYDKVVKIWDVRSERILHDLIGHTEPISHLALSHNMKTIISGSYDTTIKIWQWEADRVVLQHTLQGHTNAVSSIALSPDMKTLISGSHDTTLKLWNLSTGRLLREWTAHTEAILTVAFHPDGHTIASGSLDKTIRIWQNPSAKVEPRKGDQPVLFDEKVPVKRKAAPLQLHPFLHKEVCPSCCIEFYPDDCRILSGLTPGKVLKAPSRNIMTRWFARLRSEPLSGSYYTSQLAHRECPRCRYLLPFNIEQVQNIRLVIVGDTSSGKSHYIAALIHQIQKEWVMKSEEPIKCVCLTEDVERDFAQETDILFTQKRALSHTPTAYDGWRRPLIYELQVGKSSQTINLIIYDIAGEDFARPDRLVTFTQHLFHASAIIFLVDPLTLPYLSDKVPPHLSHLQKRSTGENAIDFFNRVFLNFERFNKGNTKSNIFSLPLAITLSKSDLMKYFLSTKQSYNFSRNPAYNTNPDLDDLVIIGHEVRSMLSQVGAQALVKMAAKFSNVQFFATSATGFPHDAQGVYPAVEPCRCIDPLLWILYQLRAIGATNTSSL